MKGITPARWRTLEPLLDRLFETPTTERGTLARSLAGGDPGLEDDLTALVAAAEVGEGILDGSAQSYLARFALEPAPPEDVIGERIGPWKVRAEIGRGGMGVVYLAERADGSFEQRAAVKLLRRGLDTDEVLERFRRERQILARLEHPHIARVLDGGASSDGRPYLAMEYVEGAPITAWCDERRLSVEARLRLFLDVGEAVEHAHRRLVVHRDLKPSNVLVTGTGEVKLLDFGIAKLLGTGEGGGGDVTLIGQRPMTLRYAAPEQVRGGPVTTATDTYGLGLILYELLVGRSPYRRGGASEEELQRAVLEQEPEDPSSTVLGDRDSFPPASDVAARRGTTPERLRKLLRGDLDAIVRTALRKEPDRRYPSAESLARDVERYLTRLPVSARPDTVAYRTRRFLTRHRGAAAAATLVVLSLVAGLVATIHQARIASRESARAQAVRQYLESLFQAAGPDVAKGKQIAARDLLRYGAERVDRELVGQPALHAEMLHVLGVLHLELGVADQAAGLLERSLALRRSLEADSLDVAATLHRLGQAQCERDQIDACEGAHREALAIRRRRLGEDTAEFSESLQAVARALRERGQYAEAETLQRQALAVARRALPSTDPALAAPLSALGVLLVNRGELEEAEALMKEAIEIYRRQPGGPGADLGLALANLGSIVRARGRLAEAEPLHREGLAIRRRMLGEDHPDVGVSLNGLGVLLMDMGRLVEAEELHRQALALRVRVLGPNDMDVANTLHNLASTVSLQGRYRDAEPHAREAARIISARRPDHPTMVAVLGRLAEIQRGTGDLAGADDTFRRAIRVARSAYPDGHPRAADVFVAFGDFLVERSRAAEAEPLLREALDVRRAKLGDGDWHTADARRALGVSLVAQQRYAEAEVLLVEAHRALKDNPYQSRRFEAAARGLVQLYGAWGQPGRAAPYQIASRP